MSTNVSSVVSHFPSAEGGFSTTTSGAVSSGATTVALNSTAGYVSGEIVVFIIDPTDATKKQVFTGVMDTGGSQVTGVVWTSGTNQGHASGATIVDYATATHISMVSKGILVEHNQDGTHKAITAASASFTGAVTTDTVSEKTVANGVTIDGMKVKDGSIQTAGALNPLYMSNPYKFSVYLAANQTGVADATFTKVLFDTELFDTNNNFASNKYTVPVNGFYQLNAHVVLGTASSGVSGIVSLYKNGSEFKRVDMGNPSGANSSATMAGTMAEIIQLTAGDTLELYVYCDVTSGTVTVGGDPLHSRFTGFLVSAT